MSTSEPNPSPFGSLKSPTSSPTGSTMGEKEKGVALEESQSQIVTSGEHATEETEAAPGPGETKSRHVIAFPGV